MKTLDFPLDFKSLDPVIPADPKLYELALNYCSRELSSMPDLRIYRKVWVAANVNENDAPVEVIGIQALQFVPDLPISRYSNSKAAKLLSRRVETYLADQGCRGIDVFVYISSAEKPEQRCGHWAEWLKIWKARPADRFLVRVR
jgi:hypothetical protein